MDIEQVDLRIAALGPWRILDQRGNPAIFGHRHQEGCSEVQKPNLFSTKVFSVQWK